MTRAPASNRAYEQATLSCAMLSVPISVYTATVSDAGIKRNLFTADGHPVGNAAIDKTTNQIIERDTIVKKIATEHGPVFVEDHEIEALLELTPKAIIIQAFQPESLFYSGAYVPKTRYFVEVAKTKQGSKKVENKPGQQALALLLAAMKQTEALALVEFTSRGIPKPAVLLSDGTLWIVYHDDELREQRGLPEIDMPQQLIDQGRALIEALWESEPQDLTDVRSAKIQALADSKAEAGDFAQSVVPELTEAPIAEPADLMALLSASVTAAKAQRGAA